MSLRDKIRKLQEEQALRVWKPRPAILCSGTIPQPLHGTVPREILGAEWWNKTRKAAYASTDYHCIACEVHKTQARYHQWLEGHEVYEIDYLLGRMTYIETLPLCHCCHNYIHRGRLDALLEKGEIHHAKYVAIVQHGDAILRVNKLIRTHYTGPTADWKDWRLIIGNREYRPKYKNLAAWEKAHG